MIEVQNLSFSYPGASSKVFDGFQLKLESGHTYGLLGRNGTGKSTLLYLASGLLRPKKGHLYIDGMESAQRDPLMLSRIFLVPEEFSLPEMAHPISILITSRAAKSICNHQAPATFS